MNKKEFLSYFKNKDEFELLKLYEKFVLAKNKNITIFTSEFYTPDIWKALENLNFSDISIENYGIFDDCDRRSIAFNKNYEEYPIKLLEIKCNTKFVNLDHKDYLGAIMALGIKRSKIGELILGNDSAYLAIHNDIADYIINNLNKIKNLSCKCKLITSNENLPIVKYEERTIISTSKRLDCIIASLCNMSRSRSAELISQGKVLINYIESIDKSCEVQENCKITIRGFGKFKISQIWAQLKVED